MLKRSMKQSGLFQVKPLYFEDLLAEASSCFLQCETLVFLFITALHSELEHFTFPKMFILVSTLMTWGKTKPADPVSGCPSNTT